MANGFIKGSLIVVCLISISLLMMEALWGLLNPFFIHNEMWQGLQFTAAIRLLEHKPLYPDPINLANYYAYAPLMPIISALGMKIFGINLFVMKIIALAFCILTLAGISLITYHLTQSRLAAVTASAIYAALGPLFSMWHFSTRPDNFATAFVIWGIIFASKSFNTKKGLSWMLLASAFFTLSALSKQTFIVYPLFFIIYTALRNNIKTAIIAAIPLLLIGGAVFLWFTTGDEYFYTTTMLLRKHRLYTPESIFNTSLNHLRNFSIPFLLSTSSFFVWRDFKRRKSDFSFWLSIYLLSFFVGFVGSIKVGGAANGYLVWGAVMSILSAVSVFHFYNSINNVKIDGGIGGEKDLVSTRHASGSFNRTTAFIVLVPIVFMISQVNQFHFTPRSDPRLVLAFEFIKKNKEKKIYFPTRNYITYLASKQYYQCDHMTVVLYSAGLLPPASFRHRIQNHYFDYILGGFRTPHIKRFVEIFYKLVKPSQITGINVYVPK